MIPVGCRETSVINYQSMLRNIAEDRKSHSNRGDSLILNVLNPDMQQLNWGFGNIPCGTLRLMFSYLSCCLSLSLSLTHTQTHTHTHPHTQIPTHKNTHTLKYKHTHPHLPELHSYDTLKTKRRLLYLNTQSVPRSKHFKSRL
jgi:hypothetical protein